MSEPNPIDHDNDPERPEDTPADDALADWDEVLQGGDLGPTIELSEEAVQLVTQLEKERDAAIEARKRALADYANFERRSRENEERARRDGAHGVLRSLLPVVDHFNLALDQDPATLTVDQLLGGLKIVREDLVKAMEAHGVKRIDPQPGDEFDPRCHEAMMRQSVEDIEPNHIVATLQPGFAAGKFVLRAAKVSVAPEAGAGAEAETEAEPERDEPEH